MKNKNVKRALLVSALSFVLCLSMFVGTTFAWFTDEVTSANNVIVAGSLDVELYHSDKAVNGEKVNNQVKLFDDVALWEPGVMVWEELTVANEGNLALKYQLSLNVLNATVVDGVSFTSMLKMAVVVDEGFNYTRQNIINSNVQWSDLASFTIPSTLLADQKHTYGVVIWWEPSDNDNMFNMNNGATEKAQVEVGVKLEATQLAYEADAFDNTYDKDAELPEHIEDAATLAAVLTANEKEIEVTLSNDVNLPIGSLGQITGGSGEYKLGGEDTESIVIDLNGHKLNVTTTYWSNLGAKNENATITIKNGSMTSSQPTGTWNSYDLCFSNCNYVFEDIVFDKAIALEGKNHTLNNVTINETHDYYAMWIPANGQTTTIDGLTINSDGRGIKIDEQYISNPEKVTLNVANATINSNKKAAIVVKSAAGADITLDNVNIDKTIDSFHAVWVDEDAADYADLVTVTGGEMIVESSVAVDLADLKDKIANATNGAYIEIVNDITGNVTVAQKAGVKFTIDGNGKTFAGVLLVDGKSATYTTAGLTVKNIVFKADAISADACIQLGNGNDATRYTCNVTVDNCTFDVPGAVGIKSYTAGDKNLIITGCTATANAHSLAQLAGVDKVLVENCTINSARGLNFNNTVEVTINGCEFDVQKYALRFGASGSSNVVGACLVKDSTIASANEEGDAAIVLRGSANSATLTITNTTITATSEIDNNAGATIVR